MIELDVDVAVIGAGFGGSLTALLIDRIGLRPVLVESGTHPRFSLGESSTPLANLVLEQLARRYDLPRLAPLANYGTWRACYPELPCGLKRGFSYFQHRPGRDFEPRADHANELLVAASRSEDDADTHWLRSEFDHFLIREALSEGMPYLDRTKLTIMRHGQRWKLVGERDHEPCCILAGFVIDASGAAGFLARQLPIPSPKVQLSTSSRAIYGHFRGVQRWQELLAGLGGQTEDHPFRADTAALHHLFDGAWMWVLPFDNGVTSAGFMLDERRFPLDPYLTAQTEWSKLIGRYPSVAKQFANAQLVAPTGGLQRTGRLQRSVANIVGPGWAMLPQAAYTLDALHSTGNAHTLAAIERLILLLQRHWGRNELTDALVHYQQTIQSEIEMLDQLVHGCYIALGHFELFASFAMFYFVAATFAEQRRRSGAVQPGDSFLIADNKEFRAALENAYRRLFELTRNGARPGDVVAFQSTVEAAIRPFNLAGLCDAARHNMYPCLSPMAVVDGIAGSASR